MPSGYSVSKAKYYRTCICTCRALCLLQNGEKKAASFKESGEEEYQEEALTNKDGIALEKTYNFEVSPSRRVIHYAADYQWHGGTIMQDFFV